MLPNKNNTLNYTLNTSKKKILREIGKNTFYINDKNKII